MLGLTEFTIWVALATNMKQRGVSNAEPREYCSTLMRDLAAGTYFHLEGLLCL